MMSTCDNVPQQQQDLSNQKKYCWLSRINTVTAMGSGNVTSKESQDNERASEIEWLQLKAFASCSPNSLPASRQEGVESSRQWEEEEEESVLG